MIKKNISFIKTLITITFFTISFKMIKKIKKTSPKTSPKSNQLNNCSINNLQDLADLFPKNVDQIKKYINNAEILLESNLVNFLNSLDQESFNVYDKMVKDFSESLTILKVLEMVSPNEEIRKTCLDESIKFTNLIINKIEFNKDVYDKLKLAQVSPELNYSLTEKIVELEKNGINLAKNKRLEIEKIVNQINQISSEFDFAINQDTPIIEISKEEKNKLKPDLIKLIKDDKITLNTPAFRILMEQANISSLREKCWRAYLNRAPENNARLKELIKKRAELANMLGFKNYASYDLSDQMAKNSETALSFLNNLIKPIKLKTKLEFERMIKDLPETVILENNKLKPWDLRFVQEDFRQKNLNINQEEIAKYFESKNTLEGLLKIYESFFNIKFKQVNHNNLFWDKDVIALELYENNQLKSYILLDLYPRDNKYSHACQITLVPAYQDCKAACLVIANFPKSDVKNPSLLKYQDVVTFFHEFGHALHSMLGRTEISFKSGTNVKTDFVEMPSQMLEEWLKEPEILKSISKHYQTGAALPEQMIKSLAEMAKFDAGFNYSTQIYYSLLALTLFEILSEEKNLDSKDYFNDHCKQIYNNIMDHIDYVPNDFLSSFGHLTGYGAKYYGYLWSKVFALDLFNKIKKENFSSQIGQKYKEIILQPGGTKDPSDILKEFLNRDPNADAFFKAIGI